MTSIFDFDDTVSHPDKINMDDLYEKRRTQNVATLNNFNKILSKVHAKIKLVSRNTSDQICFFPVPEYIIGIPKSQYDHAECIAYVINKLEANGLNVKYMHPNLIVITWNHWVPTYVREEYKKKTGIEINEFGQVKREVEVIENTNMPNNMNNMTANVEKTDEKRAKKEYMPIQSYKPLGNLIYNDEMIQKLKSSMN